MSWKQWLRTNGYGVVVSQEDVGGGCINATSRIETDKGVCLFLKLNPGCPADFFEAEAEGLGYLETAGSVRVPGVIKVGPDYLLLEYIPESPPSAGFWQQLGQQLATLHSRTSQRFGFLNDNYCGLTPQINTYETNGYFFFW